MLGTSNNYLSDRNCRYCNVLMFSWQVSRFLERLGWGTKVNAGRVAQKKCDKLTGSDGQSIHIWLLRAHWLPVRKL
jgi:hypothetical protein